MRTHMIGQADSNNTTGVCFFESELDLLYSSYIYSSGAYIKRPILVSSDFEPACIEMAHYVLVIGP